MRIAVHIVAANRDNGRDSRAVTESVELSVRLPRKPNWATWPLGVATTPACTVTLAGFSVAKKCKPKASGVD